MTLTSNKKKRDITAKSQNLISYVGLASVFSFYTNSRIQARPGSYNPMTPEQLKHAFLRSKFLYLKIELEADVDPSGYGTCSNCGENYDDEHDMQDSSCSDSYYADFKRRLKRELDKFANQLKYLEVYKDGSVDTECTLTLRVDHIADLPGIIKAFKETCLHFGNCDTNNAGMHITLLEGYLYPRTRKLDSLKIANFKKEASKLLFGLVYLGSAGDETRGFSFRELLVSHDHKHTAIYTHQDTCIEYRLFDPCYNDPDRIFEYLRVIVKTLKYYTADPTKTVKIGEALTLEKSDGLLRKQCAGFHRPLTSVFSTRAGRARLWQELDYLLSEKGRRVLNDIKSLNPATLSPELFTAIKQF